MSAILEDAAKEFDPSNAFLELWKPDAAEDGEPSGKGEAENEVVAKKPATAAEDKGTKRDGDESDQEVQDDDGDESKDAKGDKAEDDESESEDSYLDEAQLDIKVKHKVDGEEREFAVKDLLRLAGQEAALTRKSQEVATKRKQIDDAGTVQAAALDKMLKRAQEQWDPYSKIDWLTLSRREDVSTEELQALRAEAERRAADVKFLTEEYGALSKSVSTRRDAETVEAAKKCIEVLSDPTTGIEGWNEALYKDLVSFGKDSGLADEVVNGLTDPAAFKVLHMAMLYKRGKAKVVETKDAQRKKAPPKKIVKATNSPVEGRKTEKSKAHEDAMKTQHKTGSRDATVDAFVTRWAQEGDDS